MSSVTTLTLRLVLPPLHCVTRPGGFTKLPLCLAPQRRAAQGTGLRACSPSSAQALLGSQAQCGRALRRRRCCSQCAIAQVSRSCPRPPQKAWRLQRPGRAGIARPPPKGVPSTRRCGTWLVIRPVRAPVGHAVQTVKVGMHRRPPASFGQHTSRPSPAGAAQP